MHEHHWRYEPAQVTSNGAEYGPYRMCTGCPAGLVLAPILPGHPENVALVIDEADEEMLAALDAEVDSDRANEEV